MDPYDIEPGVHAHICEQPNCGWAWSHSSASLNNEDDHRCPQCHTLLGPGWLKAYPHEAKAKLAQQGATA